MLRVKIFFLDQTTEAAINKWLEDNERWINKIERIKQSKKIISVWYQEAR